MFKDRLKKTCKFIFENLIMPVLLLIVVAVTGIFIIIKVPILIDVVIWGTGLFIGLWLLIGLIVFIYWLFIEPYKNRKKGVSK